jgi:GT2 family glycosyltransferase
VTTPTFDVCIPFVGPKNWIVPCLKSVRAYSNDCRIILFANGANAELKSLAFENSGGSAMRLESPNTLPIIKPHNIMLAWSTAPYVVILNDDTEVVPGWLENMQRCFDNPKVRIAAPLLDDATCHNRLCEKGPCRDGILYDVPHVDTQCVMLSRQTIKDLGYYSEEMNYRWDTEYALRCKARGFEIAIDLRTAIKHKNGSTCGGVDPDILEHCRADNRILMQRYPNHVPLWNP